MSKEAEITRLMSRRGFLRAATAAGAGAALFGSAALPSRASAQATPSGPVSESVMRRVYEKVKTPYKYGMVVPPPQPNTYTDSGSVFRYEGMWYMVYVIYYETGRQGYETLLASSPNLLDWRPLGNILPFRPNAWDAYQAAGYISLQDPEWGGSNTLGQYDGKYWLSYIGGDDRGYEAGDLEIGVANTEDPSVAEPWTRYDEAVLKPSDGDARDWELSKLYKSNVIRDPERRFGAEFIMYYNAVTRPEAEKIGMALSDDMVNWRRYREEPILVDGAAIAGDPQVVRMGDLWVMFYFNREDYARGTNTWDSFACSYDLENWTKWDGEVLLTSTEAVDSDYAHKPWVIKHEGVVYHYYTAIGDEGWGIALATSEDLRDTSTGKDGVRASASYSFILDSPVEAVDGTISYEYSPANRWTAYQSPNEVDWLQFDFPRPRPLSGLKLYIYDEGQGAGVQSPESYNVRYLDRRGEWRDASNQRKTPETPEPEENTVAFDRVVTGGVRVYFAHRNGGAPSGNVYSGVTEVEFTA